MRLKLRCAAPIAAAAAAVYAVAADSAAASRGAQRKEAAQIEAMQIETPAVARAAVNTPEATGRALAKMRRAALNQDGKNGLKRIAQATRIAASMPAQDWQSAMLKGATGVRSRCRHRLVQALAGRMDKTSGAGTRPTGRVRARNVVEAPAKVEEGHTLLGRPSPVPGRTHFQGDRQ